MSDCDFMLPGQSVSMAETTMAATSHQQAMPATHDTPRADDNAMDAAVTTMAPPVAIAPHMTEIGVGCLAPLAFASGELICVDGSGRTPAAIDTVALHKKSRSKIAQRTPNAVTAPGAVAAWGGMSERQGRLRLGHGLQHAIAAACAGFRATPRVALDWARCADTIARTPGAATVLLPGTHLPLSRPTARCACPCYDVAVGCPRGPLVFLEKGARKLDPTLDPVVKEQSQRRGNIARWIDEPLGGSHAIWVDRERDAL